MKTLKWTLAWLSLLLLQSTAHPQESDACTHFKWDVSHERSLMLQEPQPIDAATSPAATLPRLQLDTLYELRLAPQSAVKFALPPGEERAADDAHAGLVQFRVGTDATYRVSISTGHWVDVVDGKRLIESRDFSSEHDCDRPHKLVQFDLPGGRALILQLSGSQASAVLVAISPVVGEH
jgi:hypothetical protein